MEEGQLPWGSLEEKGEGWALEGRPRVLPCEAISTWDPELLGLTSKISGSTLRPPQSVHPVQV